MGDSYGSGEGVPDKPQVYHPKPFPLPGWDLDHPAVWQDERCHRSAFSASSLAAIALEKADPHTSVTFISFACSGATINKLSWDLGFSWQPLGAGFLRPYWGAVPVGVPYSDDFTDYIPPQMDQLEDAMIPPAGEPARQIDALIISGGGNDIHFGDILLSCFFDSDCWRDDFTIHENPYNPTDYTLENIIQRDLGHWGAQNPENTLPQSYLDLHERINALQPGKPSHVYLTQYPDLMRDDDGSTCSLMEDVFMPNIFDYKISTWEASQARWRALIPLNNHVREVAQTYVADGWQFVDGLSVYDVDPLVEPGTDGLFVSGHDGLGHGYCASNNWIRRAEEAELIQGPLNIRIATRGQMHPNYAGNSAVKERLLRYMIPNLAIDQPQAPPEFSFSFSLNGYTDVVSQDTGWYLGSCTSENQCQPKVVAQAVATSTVDLYGTQFNVNGVVGCTTDVVEGVSCDIPESDNPNQVSFNIEITASGIYQFSFMAEDSSGQAASLEQEIHVDLDAPVIATPVGPFEVQEGGSVNLSAYASSQGENVFVYEWDLDNDGIFETIQAAGEQPVFSAVGLDGPGSQTVWVKVTDRAGRTDTEPATVNVLNVAPTAVINGAPATGAEGTAINLTSTVTDPGIADTFTYAWEVKKNGSYYASGANAGFSFTPDDNGAYAVTLSVTDDDGGIGTPVSQAIAITNVAPVLSNVKVSSGTVSEGGSVTLGGSISDAGSADTLVLTIDWGDGSASESVPLPAGSTSFSRSHIYADDNPNGTASDTNVILLSIADDDGGTGTGSASLIVNNLAPSLSISGPESGSLYSVNAVVDLSASLTDASSLDILTWSINWDDGVIVSGKPDAGAFMASHSYTAAGVYSIQVKGLDDDTGEKTKSVMVVVYDPSAGFVTGGGWIQSPMGAYKLDETLTGKATFGFVSKYQKGASVPTGNTAFKFEVAGLAFASQSYDWLVVNQAGMTAQFKGIGLINGLADPNGNAYKFMLWAGDGSPDTFRIRIWWEDAAGEHVVYDNGVAQAIGAGNIVVHTNK